jgi:hypothetical protein
MTLVNGYLTFVMPLVAADRPPAYREYLNFGTIETVCTSVIIGEAWTWSAVGAAVSAERIGNWAAYRVVDDKPPYHNGPGDLRDRRFTTVDRSLSICTRWISSGIADFFCVPVR